jgi:hypothetical protein
MNPLGTIIEKNHVRVSLPGMKPPIKLKWNRCNFRGKTEGTLENFAGNLSFNDSSINLNVQVPISGGFPHSIGFV